uniref:Putative secreted protein n=1 Tax=Anopheles darlingi TaxID=43151 RepID=A0A2M4D6U5_ANODA
MSYFVFSGCSFFGLCIAFLLYNRNRYPPSNVTPKGAPNPTGRPGRKDTPWAVSVLVSFGCAPKSKVEGGP